MANDKHISDFNVYSIGIVCASVCTSLPIEQAVEIMNKKYPTGISSKWQLSSNPTFLGGELNGCSCHDYPTTHKHYLLNC